MPVFHPSFLGLAIAASTAAAQPCMPFWAGLNPLNPYLPRDYFRHATVSDVDGRSVYFSSGTSTLKIIRWVGRDWQVLPMTGLTTSEASALGGASVLLLDEGMGPRLHAIGGVSARWDLTHWTVLSPGFADVNGSKPIGSFDFGSGSRIYGIHAVQGVGNFFSVWTGTAWEHISQVSGLGSSILFMTSAIEGPTPAVYLFGGLTLNIGGLQTRGFARWDGATWTCPSMDFVGGAAGHPAFAVYDDGTGPQLYTNHGTLQSSPNCYIKRWDGQTWECFANPDVPPFTIAAMNILEVFDDGRGPALYIGGFFQGVNGHPARNLIRYDGKSWEEVGGGIGSAWHSAVVDDARGTSLFINYGDAFSVGGGTVDAAVLWTGCATPQCKADCDRSGRLNVRDFACFINAFADRDPYANCDGDAVISVADFACYLNLFRQGCP